VRTEFLGDCGPFANIKAAQQAFDVGVSFYNSERPHQALQMATPASRFRAGTLAPGVTVSPPPKDGLGAERAGSDWLSRKVTTNGVVCVSWQQVSLGRHYAGSRCDVHVDGELLRFYIGDVLVKTAARKSTGAVRNKRALRSRAEL